MPYQTYTNDSDAQFAAELDKFKLGPGIRPGSTAKSASEAAMDSMGNDYKNVADLMQARATLGAASMGTRKSISEDVMNKQASDDFDSYSSMMTEGFTGDPVKDAALRQQASLRFGDNEQAMRHLSSMAKSDQDQILARGFKAQNRAMDEDDANWESDVEMRRQQRGLNLGKMEMEKKQLILLNDSTDEELYGFVQDQAGGLIPRAPELAKKILKVGYRLDSAKDFRTARELGSVTSNFSRSSLLEEAYRSEITAMSPHISRINTMIGMDISSAKTPDEYDKMLALTKSKISTLPEKDQKNAQEALDIHSNLMSSQFLRVKLQEDFESHMDKAPDDMASPEAQEWKAGLAILKAEGKYIGGIINKKQEELTQRQSLEDRAYETRKRSLDILDKTQDLKFDAEDQTLQRMKQEWEMEKVPRSEQFKILMAASKGKNTPAEVERILDMLQDKWADNQASQTNFGSLYPKK